MQEHNKISLNHQKMDYLSTLKYKRGRIVDSSGYPQNELIVLSSINTSDKPDQGAQSSVTIGTKAVKVNVSDGINPSPGVIKSITTPNAATAGLDLRGEGTGAVRVGRQNENYLNITGSDTNNSEVVFSGESSKNSNVDIVIKPKGTGVVKMTTVDTRVELTTDTVSSRASTGDVVLAMQSGGSAGTQTFSNSNNDSLITYAATGKASITVSSSTNTDSNLSLNPKGSGQVSTDKRVIFQGTKSTPTSITDSGIYVRNNYSDDAIAVCRANNAAPGFSLERAGLIGRLFSLNTLGQWDIRDNTRYEAGTNIFRVEPSGRITSPTTYQAGTQAGGTASGTTTFSTAFSTNPVVHATCDTSNTANVYSVQITAISTTSFSWRKVYQPVANTTGAWTAATGESFTWVAFCPT